MVIAGADTFRAAAGDQLKEWANRAGVDMIGGAEGADPGAVVYDAVAASKARNADVLLVDTAGRLHNKKNLMNELGKINKILESEYPDAYRETLVVLDEMCIRDRLCGGAGILEEDCGSSYYVTCLECGCHSVNIDFKSDDDRLDAAKRTADLWNCGKVISMSPGE